MEVAAVNFGCWLVGRGFTIVGLRVGLFWVGGIYGCLGYVRRSRWVRFWGSFVTVVVGVLVVNGFSWVAISEFVGCLW